MIYNYHSLQQIPSNPFPCSASPKLILDDIAELLFGCESMGDSSNYVNDDFADRWEDILKKAQAAHRGNIPADVESKIQLTYSFFALLRKISLFPPERKLSNSTLGQLIIKYQAIVKDLRASQDFLLLIQQIETGALAQKVDNHRPSPPIPRCLPSTQILDNSPKLSNCRAIMVPQRSSPEDLKAKIQLTCSLFDAFRKIKQKNAFFPSGQKRSSDGTLGTLMKQYHAALHNSRTSQDFHLCVQQIETGELEKKVDDHSQVKSSKTRKKITQEAVDCATHQFKLRNQFLEDRLLKEIAALPTEVTAADMFQRKDLRNEMTITIDPPTAKDFDDALSLEKTAEGYYRMRVHIADVSHYVKPGSAIDQEAQERANSVYLQNTCISMLPHELSEGLCSLQEGKDRLAITHEMLFDQMGNLLSDSFSKSVIRNDGRLTYKEADAAYHGTIPSKFQPLLILLVELFFHLKKQRGLRGAADISLPEKVFQFDEDGTPIGLEAVDHDIMHQVVEELMLKTNERVAFYLTKQQKTIPYRIHPISDNKNREEFLQLTKMAGYSLPDNLTLQEITSLFAKHEFRQLFAKAYANRMEKAFYAIDHVGHYSLQLPYYCHFTSPIRRYIDLVIHRILFGENYSAEWLSAIAKHCSDREKMTKKAENFVKTIYKVHLANNLYRSVPDNKYEAIVTNVEPSGFAFEIPSNGFDGFFCLAEQDRNSSNRWQYDSTHLRFQDQGSDEKIALGSLVDMRITGINEDKREIKWSIIQPKKRLQLLSADS